MRKLMLVPVFVIVLGGLQTVALDNQVHAKHRLWHCCTPGMCDTTCYCCWKTAYCTCVVPDAEPIDSHHHADEITVDIRRLSEPRAFNIADSNFAERLETLMAGVRARGLVTLKILDGNESSLKVWCPGSDKSIHQDNTVALRIAEKEEH